MNRAIGGILAALATVCFLGCNAGSGGKSTPEATFESFKTAMKGKDYKGAFTHVAPDSQEMALAGMAMVVSMASQDPKVADDAGKLLEKHNIKPVNPLQMMAAAASGGSPEAEIKKSVVATKDKPAAFHDIILWLEKNVPQAPGDKNPMERMSEAVLVDVKVENDTATGSVKIKGPDGKEESQPAKFRKIDGVWLIEFEKPAAPAGPPAGIDLPSGDTPNFAPPALPNLPSDGHEGLPATGPTAPPSEK